MRRASPTLWIVLVLGAVLSGLASWSMQRTLPVSEKRTQGADHSLIQPKAWLFDEQGLLAYQASGTRLDHLIESGDYLLHNAHLIVEPSSGHADGWIIDAEQARFLTHRKTALLAGNVSAQRQHVAAEDAITITARDIILDLASRTATSNEPMQVKGRHWVSQSSVFRADFSSEQLTQEGRVHDRHEPPRP